MERGVFTLHEVEELFKNYVVVSVVTDLGDEKADALWAEYGPEKGGIPHYVVLNHDKEVQRRIGSTLPPDENGHKFVSFLKGEEVGATATATNPPDADNTPEAPKGWPKGLFGPPTAYVTDGMDFKAEFAADKVKPGAQVSLVMHFVMKDNGEGEIYWAYHPGTKATDINQPLQVKLKDDGGLAIDGDWQFPEPASKKDDGFGEEWKLPQVFTVVGNFTVPEDIKPGTYRVSGHIYGQYCDSGKCIFFNNSSKADHIYREFGWVADLTVANDGVAEALVEPTVGESGAPSKPDEIGPDEPESNSGLTSQIEERGLLLFLLFAFGMGMVTLLTPCVLPVLPLTVGFFVSQSEKGRSSLLTAGIYCACIIVSFTLFGLITSLTLGATGAQNIATNGWVNSFLAILFMTFALSFLGLFELKVPNFITGWFTKKQMNAQKEGNGYAKALFSGSAFALISFSCTGPIAGAFLASAATGSVWLPTLAMLAFSAGLALPIFVLGQFPSLMKKMPKSGGWMNAMKVVFGFIEVGLAIMYLSAAEQAFGNSTAAEWVNRYVVLAVWVSVSVAAAVYLFGFFRMPHDHEKIEKIGVIRSLIAVSFLSFALYITPGLFGAQFGPTLEGILPLPPENGGIQLSMGGEGGTSGRNDIKALTWFEDLDEGLKEAEKVGKPVFIDFTGFN